LLVSASLGALAACATQHRPDATRCEYCPQMVVIPAGEAVIGAHAGEAFGHDDERPQRTIRIPKPFAVSKFEITRGQYAAFMRESGRKIEGQCLTDRRKLGDWQYDAATTFQDPGFAQTDEHPVACVSFEEARAFIDWLNQRTHGGYRLLTETEWEYIARAGSPQGAWPWGDDPAAGCRSANGLDAAALDHYRGMDTSGYKVYDPLPCRDGWLNTSPVGSLAGNAFGVHDLIGNVAEWVEDCYTRSHDALDDQGKVMDGDCQRRLVKGGSWGTLAHNLRTAERVPYPPTHRDDSVGIRVARTLDDSRAR
jgi:formylglycine-generating enzyme required for sulfatase activity